MVIKCLCFDGVKKTVKIVRFVLESCTFRFRDYTYTTLILFLMSNFGDVFSIRRSKSYSMQKP